MCIICAPLLFFNGFDMLLISYLTKLVIVIIYLNIYSSLLEIKHTTYSLKFALNIQMENEGLIFDNLLSSI